jgi:hypothetical protein
MPFAEMARRVTGSLERFGDGDLLRAKRVSPLEAAEAVGVAARHHAAAGGRTHGGSGVEAVEPQGFGGHAVEVGRLEVLVAVIRHIAPALVVGHDEYDVGLFRCWCSNTKADESNVGQH